MSLPVPDHDRPVRQLVSELADLVGLERFVEVCTDLMGGADRAAYVDELRYLTGHDWGEHDPVRDRETWKDYWPRTWGARGLLHVWSDGASDAVVAGLSDEHWRPAEMCLKVAARHEVAGTGPGAARLATHELPRVRAQALRALAVVGDTEHADVVRRALDDPDPAVRTQAARAWERMSARLDL